MPHSQEYDGIQLYFEGIKYAPFTGIWWHTDTFEDINMPHSQDYDGMQIHLKASICPIHRIMMACRYIWRHKVCPIHRNLMAYRYIWRHQYAPFTGVWWHADTFEGIKYAPFTGVWWLTDILWRHQICHAVHPMLVVTLRPCAVSLSVTVKQSMSVLVNIQLERQINETRTRSIGGTMQNGKYYEEKLYQRYFVHHKSDTWTSLGSNATKDGRLTFLSLLRV